MRSKIRSGCCGIFYRLELVSTGELLEDKLKKGTLQKGLLLEFKKDSERLLLAVALKPDGKKNWMVSDQVYIEILNDFVLLDY